MGRTAAIFILSGTNPEPRLVLIIVTIDGIIAGRHCFKSNVGMGSSSLDLEGELIMIDLISLGVVGDSLSKVIMFYPNYKKGSNWKK